MSCVTVSLVMSFSKTLQNISLLIVGYVGKHSLQLVGYCRSTMRNTGNTIRIS